MCRELSIRGIEFRRQVKLPIQYKGILLDCGYRIDLVVGDTVVIELKSVDKLEAVHEAQLLSYLGLSGKKVGLLINFNVAVLKYGIVRRVFDSGFLRDSVVNSKRRERDAAN